MAQKKKAAKAEEKVVINPVRIARQAWLASLGGYAKAFEEAKDRVDGLRERAKSMTARREELVKELVGKGEEVETKAEESLKEARSNVVDFAKPRLEKIRSLIPAKAESKGNRVDELETEIEKLNRKISSLTKKIGSTTVSKAPAKKAAAKKPAVKKAPVKKASVNKTVTSAAAAKPATTTAANSVSADNKPAAA